MRSKVTSATQRVGESAQVAKGWVALGLVQIRGAIDGGLRGIRVARFLLSPFS